MNMFKAIHLSRVTANQVKRFEGQIPMFFPRIPFSRLPGENDFSPRVCLTYDIEGSLAAMPSEYLLKKQEELKLGRKKYKGAFFAVHEFMIAEDDPNFISSLDLEKEVPDADLTGECWYTQRISPNNVYYIVVENPREVANGDMGFNAKYKVVEV